MISFRQSQVLVPELEYVELRLPPPDTKRRRQVCLAIVPRLKLALRVALSTADHGEVSGEETEWWEKLKVYLELSPFVLLSWLHSFSKLYRRAMSGDVAQRTIAKSHTKSVA